MPRGRRRTWVKIFCYERLHGSVTAQLAPDERSVWDELLCLAGLCGMEGLIADHDRRPFPHEYIAHELHISLELLERTLQKCIEEGRITEDELGIHITNWKTYQSEYERQKPYRKETQPGKASHKVCPTCGYKKRTADEYCPECDKKGVETVLNKDYKAGKYGHLVGE